MKQTQRMMGWAAGALLTCIVSFIAPGCGDGDSPNTIQPITGGNGGTAGGTGGANSGGSSGKGGSSGQGGSSGTGGVGGSSGTGGSSAGGTGGANVGGQDAGGSGGADADAGGTGGNDPDGGDADTGTGGNVDSGTGGASGDAGTGGSASDSGTGGTGGTIVVPCPANCSGHGTCNDQNGVCSCATGFDGAGCDQCASGYKNYPECYLIKTCPADCSGHGSCDDKTGQCSCATGFAGTACDSCASGYKSYPTCYAIQTCPANCSGHGTCNDQTGQCACNTGFAAPDCASCASGYANYPTCYQVTACPGNNCSGHGTCNDQNGVCSCATGFDGAGCDQCASGYKNYPECYLIKTCPADCSGHGSCDDKTGQCSCATGFAGTACDSCASGYKSYPTCYAIQTCPANCSGHGTCNDQTGQCACNTGFDTANCGACASGYTGYPNCQIPPQPFSCSNYARNAAFDQFKIDGNDVSLVGGVWGTGASNVYVTAATYTKGTVAHWNGSTWVNEELTPTPLQIGDISGTGTNDVWTVGRQTAPIGAIYHRTNNSWTQDSSQPSARTFTHVWTNQNSVYVVGTVLEGIDDVTKVWIKSGNSWTMQSTPSFTGSVEIWKVWGLDSQHVFAAGTNDTNKDGNTDSGVLWYFNGSSWTSVQVPADCRELRAIHGTCLGDLWATGITTSGKGVVYRITNDLATWTPYVNQNLAHYQPIFSARAGTAFAVGGLANMDAGNMRITTFDQVSQPATTSVDSQTFGPGVDTWYNSGKMYFVNITPGLPIHAGVYTADCN